MIDTGLSAAEAASFAETAGEYVDFIRLGWGTAYVTNDLEAKLDAYRSRGVPVLLGGTLTELAWPQGRVDEFARLAEGARASSTSRSRAAPSRSRRRRRPR